MKKYTIIFLVTLLGCGECLANSATNVHVTTTSTNFALKVKPVVAIKITGDLSTNDIVLLQDCVTTYHGPANELIKGIEICITERVPRILTVDESDCRNISKLLTDPFTDTTDQVFRGRESSELKVLVAAKQSGGKSRTVVLFKRPDSEWDIFMVNTVITDKK